ncbi:MULTISPECIES: SDR family oxidoreductase [unclassified Bradyrhizobium]|uniref:SDR family NAD(P)-dependent oxidoreductase n=1 Tax=unclassified Bradyrhizobium TaxID=2631580 RepID=UPI00339953C0
MTKFDREPRNEQSRIRGWSLEGRVALVTGAAGGLGKAIVAELSDRGADVHGVDVVGEDVFRADLATPDGNRDMIAHVLKVAGRLDILVLNAGVQFMAPLDQFPEAEWDRLHALMLDGPFHALKAAWPALTKSPGGRVVVTASVASFGGGRQKSAYCAAKHGVLGLVRTAALEGGALGLTVNAVAPGWVDTGLMRSQLETQSKQRGMSTDEVMASFRASQPGNRFVEAHEVASAIGFLASPSASGINGECITIDLGASAS